MIDPIIQQFLTLNSLYIMVIFFILYILSRFKLSYNNQDSILKKYDLLLMRYEELKELNELLQIQVKKNEDLQEYNSIEMKFIKKTLNLLCHTVDTTNENNVKLLFSYGMYLKKYNLYHNLLNPIILRNNKCKNKSDEYNCENCFKPIYESGNTCSSKCKIELDKYLDSIDTTKDNILRCILCDEYVGMLSSKCHKCEIVNINTILDKI
jgi:hypothetical protein